MYLYFKIFRVLQFMPEGDPRCNGSDVVEKRYFWPEIT